MACGHGNLLTLGCCPSWHKVGQATHQNTDAPASFCMPPSIHVPPHLHTLPLCMHMGALHHPSLAPLCTPTSVCPSFCSCAAPPPELHPASFTCPLRTCRGTTVMVQPHCLLQVALSLVPCAPSPCV